MHKTQRKWSKAAILGSLWASLEIIFGSFLHNLRFPFSGTFLAFIGIILLIAFQTNWKENGVIWRAGLICALMKSVSPSAVILGPMVGIFMEALILEIIIKIFGNHLFAYLIGGGIALLWVLFQKITNLLISFGWNLVKIAENIYYYALKQLKIVHLAPQTLLIILMSSFVFIGIFAALNGYFIGLKSRKIKLSENPLLSENKEALPFSGLYSDNYKLLFLFLHIFILFIALYILHHEKIIFAAIFIVLYMGFCFYRYPNSTKKLKKPLFWGQLIILGIASSFLYKDSEFLAFSNEGLTIGAEMNLRAILIVMVFTSFSVELRNPLVKSIFQKKGNNLYKSLELAFSSLSQMISFLPAPLMFFKKPFYVLPELIAKTQFLLDDLHENKAKVFIISADIHSGKTTFCAHLIKELKSKGLQVGGFLAKGNFKNNQRHSFILCDLLSDQKQLLCSRDYESNWIPSGQFFFDPEAINFGNQILKTDYVKEADIVFIDEIGNFELKGFGWTDSLQKLLETNEKHLLLVVRKSLMDEVLKKWNITPAEVFCINQETKTDFVANKILNVINQKHE